MNTRILYLVAGWASVGLGTVGAFVPVLPTTCFMIAALWFFSRSSPEIAAKLLQHPRFGAALQAWVRDRAIPTQIKVVAVGSLIFSAGIVILTVGNSMVVAAVVGLLTAVAVYIVTRPSAAAEIIEVQS